MKKLSYVLFFSAMQVCFVPNDFCGKHDHKKPQNISFKDFLSFVRAGRVKEVEAYFAAFEGSPRAATAADEYGITALHFVPTERMSNLLILHGANVNAADVHGRTPLHYAVNNAVARVLLNAHGDVALRDVEGRTALFYARTGGIVEQLVAHGARVDVRDVHGNQPIHVATNADVLGALIAADADVNAINDANQRPFEYLTDNLHNAVMRARDEQEGQAIAHIGNEILLELLRHHARITNDPANALLYEAGLLDVVGDEFLAACIAGNRERVEELLATDVPMRTQDEDQLVLLPRAERPAHDIAPLAAAVAQGYIDIVNVLLEAGAQPIVEHIRIAERNGFAELGRVLRGAIVDQVVVPRIEVTAPEAQTPAGLSPNGEFVLVTPPGLTPLHSNASTAAIGSAYIAGCTHSS